MATSNTPTNTPVEIVDQLINDLLKGVGLAQAYRLIVQALPFLGWGPIGWVVGLVVNWIGGKIFAALEKLVSFKIIDWETIAEDARYTAAVAQLKAAQAAQDPVKLSQASQEFKDTLKKLIHFDGS